MTIPGFLEYFQKLIRHNPPVVGGLSRATARVILVERALPGSEFGDLVASLPGARWRPLERVWEIPATQEAADQILDLADLCDVHVTPIAHLRLRKLVSDGQL
jgi:hypothetical protein